MLFRSTGTSPLVVASTTLVSNLTAQYLGAVNQDAAYFTNATNLSSGTVASGRISGSYTGITGVGALSAGSIASGFGSINIGGNALTCGAITSSGNFSTTGTLSLKTALGVASTSTNTAADAATLTFSPGNTLSSANIQYIQSLRNVTAVAEIGRAHV